MSGAQDPRKLVEEFKRMILEELRSSRENLGYPVKVRKVGKQLVIPLPKRIVEQLGLQPGMTVYLEVAVDAGRSTGFSGGRAKYSLVVNLP